MKHIKLSLLLLISMLPAGLTAQKASQAVLCFVPLGNSSQDAAIAWLSASITPALQNSMKERFDFISQPDCTALEQKRALGLYNGTAKASLNGLKKTADEFKADFVLAGFYNRKGNTIEFQVDVYRLQSKSVTESIKTSTPASSQMFSAIDKLSDKVVNHVKTLAVSTSGTGKIAVKQKNEKSTFVYRLRKGETVFNGEYLAGLYGSNIDSVFVTLYRKKYYLIKGKRRFGPFESAPYATFSKDRNHMCFTVRVKKKYLVVDESFKKHGPYEKAGGIRFIKGNNSCFYYYGKNNLLTLRAGNKTYGPYKEIPLWYMADDKKGNWALKVKKADSMVMLLNGKESGSFKDIGTIQLDNKANTYYTAGGNGNWRFYKNKDPQSAIIENAKSIVTPDGRAYLAYTQNKNGYVQTPEKTWGPYKYVNQYTMRISKDTWMIKGRNQANKEGLIINGTFRQLNSPQIYSSDDNGLSFSYKNKAGKYMIEFKGKRYGPYERIYSVYMTGDGPLIKYKKGNQYYLAAQEMTLGPFDSSFYPRVEKSGHWGFFGRKGSDYFFYSKALLNNPPGPFKQGYFMVMDSTGNWAISAKSGNEQAVFYNGIKTGVFTQTGILQLHKGLPFFDAARKKDSTVVFRNQEHGTSDFGIRMVEGVADIDFVWHRVDDKGRIYRVTW